jgi:hypothetical protein
MRDKLEYKMRGACVSIDCEPKNVDASCMDSIDQLAASCIALRFGQGDRNIYSKHVKKIWSKNSDQTHDRRLCLGFLLEIVMEFSSRTKTRKMVQCYMSSSLDETTTLHPWKSRNVTVTEWANMTLGERSWSTGNVRQNIIRANHDFE